MTSLPPVKPLFNDLVEWEADRLAAITSEHGKLLTEAGLPKGVFLDKDRTPAWQNGY
ncbi:hypothetical protein ACNPQM_36725 [Streptomyces sp. NPDC056231]|uniref:hypothetical protein n=1 Tax=Streptomyces sp. NPDC056231 TaxID=3345755 RepID=UPI003AACA98C